MSRLSTKKSKSKRPSIRFAPKTLRLIDRAAEIVTESRSFFVERAARERASQVIANANSSN